MSKPSVKFIAANRPDTIAALKHRLTARHQLPPNLKASFTKFGLARGRKSEKLLRMDMFVHQVESVLEFNCLENHFIGKHRQVADCDAFSTNLLAHLGVTEAWFDGVQVPPMDQRENFWQHALLRALFTFMHRAKILVQTPTLTAVWCTLDGADDFNMGEDNPIFQDFLAGHGILTKGESTPSVLWRMEMALANAAGTHRMSRGAHDIRFGLEFNRDGKRFSSWGEFFAAYSGMLGAVPTAGPPVVPIPQPSAHPALQENSFAVLDGYAADADVSGASSPPEHSPMPSPTNQPDPKRARLGEPSTEDPPIVLPVDYHSRSARQPFGETGTGEYALTATESRGLRPPAVHSVPIATVVATPSLPVAADTPAPPPSPATPGTAPAFSFGTTATQYRNHALRDACSSHRAAFRASRSRGADPRHRHRNPPPPPPPLGVLHTPPRAGGRPPSLRALGPSFRSSTFKLQQCLQTN